MSSVWIYTIVIILIIFISIIAIITIIYVLTHSKNPANQCQVSSDCGPLGVCVLGTGGNPNICLGGTGAVCQTNTNCISPLICEPVLGGKICTSPGITSSSDPPANISGKVGKNNIIAQRKAVNWGKNETRNIMAEMIKPLIIDRANTSPLINGQIVLGKPLEKPLAKPKMVKQITGQALNSLPLDLLAMHNDDTNLIKQGCEIRKPTVHNVVNNNKSNNNKIKSDQVVNCRNFDGTPISNLSAVNSAKAIKGSKKNKGNNKGENIRSNNCNKCNQPTKNCACLQYCDRCNQVTKDCTCFHYVDDPDSGTNSFGSDNREAYEPFDVHSDDSLDSIHTITTPYDEKDGVYYCHNYKNEIYVDKSNKKNRNNRSVSVIDVCSYSDSVIFLLENGDIIRENKSKRIRVTNNIKLMRITSFKGYLYGLDFDGKLHTLSNDNLGSNIWNWTSCHWISVANVANIANGVNKRNEDNLRLKTKYGVNPVKDNSSNFSKDSSSNFSKDSSRDSSDDESSENISGYNNESYENSLEVSEIKSEIHHEIIHISSTLDGSYLWLQTKDMGYLFEEPGVIKESLHISHKRVYGKSHLNYLDIDQKFHSAKLAPGFTLIKDIYDGALSYYGEVVAIKPSERRNFRGVTIVDWKPYYIRR